MFLALSLETLDPEQADGLGGGQVEAFLHFPNLLKIAVLKGDPSEGLLSLACPSSNISRTSRRSSWKDPASLLPLDCAYPTLVVLGPVLVAVAPSPQNLIKEHHF